MDIKPRWVIATTLWLASTAQATDWCVQDQPAFAGALLAAKVVPGTNRILVGANKTFQLGGTALDSGDYEVRGALTIEGGYDDDCSAVTTLDAASSVLDGSTLQTPSIYVFTRNDFTLSRLTVANVDAYVNITNPDGDGAPGMRFRLTHTRFLDGSSVDLRIGDVEDAGIRVEDSLFARMSDETSAVRLSGNSADIVVAGSTFTRNRGDGLATTVAGNAVVSAFNNILYGNGLAGSGHDDLSATGSILARNNIVGSFDGSYFPGSGGNLSADPLFVSTTDFNLQLASPARESGTPSVPGGLSAYDVAGGARVVGVVDRGAYEADTSGAPILVVTNTNDAGAGSLRAAITEANADADFTIIGFNIGGGCPRTITLASALPAITRSTSIRGYTQAGASANSEDFGDDATLCIALTKAAGGAVANGLAFAPSADDVSFDVSGLAIGGFDNAGILVDPVGVGADYDVWGNFIGLAADGTTLRANALYGIDVRGDAAGNIGGDDDERRNLVAGSLFGIHVDAGQGASIRNNFIGTTRSGDTARPNSAGVSLDSSHNQVRYNLVSGNSGFGIDDDGDFNAIVGNRVGLKRGLLCGLSSCDLGNGSHGVLVRASHAFVANNAIAYNGDAGVAVTGDGHLGNIVSRNSVYANDGLGIDLGTTGVDPINNDATTASGPNRGINHPVPTNAGGGHRSGVVSGTLASTNDTYLVEFFASDTADASGYGEGRTWIGSVTVQITNSGLGNGSATFTAAIASTSDLDDQYISATARDTAGNTSEFSVAVTYQFTDLIFANGFEP